MIESELKLVLDRINPSPVTRRGRARGPRGARGSTRGAAALSSTLHPNGATSTVTSATNHPLSTGRSRGSGVTRKPRITKAQREKFEQESRERESVAVLAARPTGYAIVGAAGASGGGGVSSMSVGSIGGGSGVGPHFYLT